MKETGEEVSLTEMMNARERRCAIQRRLLLAHRKPLICLTLNIPGPVKVLPKVPEAFAAGCRQIENVLREHQIPLIRAETIREKTGYEAFYCVDASPETVKALTTALEDRDRLGRLFDVDVLRPDGTKVSREELGFAPRRCLLCGRPAQVCARSRAHGVPELVAEVSRILEDTTR